MTSVTAPRRAPVRRVFRSSPHKQRRIAWGGSSNLWWGALATSPIRAPHIEVLDLIDAAEATVVSRRGTFAEKSSCP